MSRVKLKKRKFKKNLQILTIILFIVSLTALMTNPLIIKAISTTFTSPTQQEQTSTQQIIVRKAINVTLQQELYRFIQVITSTKTYIIEEAEIQCGKITYGNYTLTKSEDGIIECFEEVEISRDKHALSIIFKFLAPKETLYSIEKMSLKIRYNASDTNEEWYIWIWDWINDKWSTNGLNITSFKPENKNTLYYINIGINSFLENYVNSNGEVRIKIVDKYFIDNGIDKEKTYLGIDLLELTIYYYETKKEINLIAIIISNMDIDVIGNLTIYASFHELIYNETIEQYQYISHPEYKIASIPVYVAANTTVIVTVPYILNKVGIYLFRAEYEYKPILKL